MREREKRERERRKERKRKEDREKGRRERKKEGGKPPTQTAKIPKTYVNDVSCSLEGVVWFLGDEVELG